MMEPIAALAQLLGPDSHVLQEGNEVVDIQDVRNIVDGYLPACQQHSAEYLKHLVFCSLRIDLTREPVASFYYERRHIVN